MYIHHMVSPCGIPQTYDIYFDMKLCCVIKKERSCLVVQWLTVIKLLHTLEIYIVI
jgi:hypothetical protein